MSRVFSSQFSERISTFIAEKQQLGYPYNGGEYYLWKFDSFCLEQFSSETALVKEICLAWATKRETEQNVSFNHRISSLREFARYLNRNGEAAYVIPNYYGRKVQKRVPYIYSEAEVALIWKTFEDVLQPVNWFTTRNIVLPALVRLLYCCGMRPCETRKLKLEDVTLATGRIFIRESKGIKDRIVLAADDVCEYLRVYNAHIASIYPKREWFFPSAADKPVLKHQLDNAFVKVRKALPFVKDCHQVPRLYDLRHTFATHRLYKWLREGRDITAVIPFLSAYMGHQLLSDTYYYIHLVPEQLQVMSGLDFSKYNVLLPEAEIDE